METGTGSKIGNVAERYGLDDIKEELISRRVDEGDSLRDLADYFNRRLLEIALREAGQSPLDGEVENYYRLLTDDDVSEGMRVQARNQLDTAGVDSSDIKSDFVSYQTVNRFLKSHIDREASAEAEERDPSTRVFKLRNRMESVMNATLRQLEREETISLGEFSVYVSLNIVCEDCNKKMGFRELLDVGSCDC